MKKPFEQCAICKHQLIMGCCAFPGAIPSDYAQGIKIHNKIDKNQIGEFIFEEKTPYLEIESKQKE